MSYRSLANGTFSFEYICTNVSEGKISTIDLISDLPTKKPIYSDIQF